RRSSDLHPLSPSPRGPHPLSPSPRCGEGERRSSTDAATRGRAPSSLPPAAEAPAHPTGERAPGARRGQDAALPAGVLWSPDVRLDAGGDARALTVERGRAGAVRRVHVPPEPVRVL